MNIFGFDDLFNAGPSSSPTPKTKKFEKGIPWQAKVIDGRYYVPLAQVAELLAQNDALPAVRKGIEARVRSEKKES